MLSWDSGKDMEMRRQLDGGGDTHWLSHSVYLSTSSLMGCHLFIWLRWVLVAAREIFVVSCGSVIGCMGFVACGLLVPWPRIKPISPALQGGFFFFNMHIILLIIFGWAGSLLLASCGERSLFYLRYLGSSLQRLLLMQSTGSRCSGFRSCNMWAQ